MIRLLSNGRVEKPPLEWRHDARSIFPPVRLILCYPDRMDFAHPLKATFVAYELISRFLEAERVAHAT